jgi:eukaryotic-like serine/threonine-protein kinase
MSDHRHQVEDLYQAAVKRPAGQRAAFLLEVTAGDAPLRQKVESLLAHQFPEEFACEPPGQDFAELPLNPAIRSTDLTQSYPADPLIGTKISHYRVAEKLGAGGMGVVYRAHDERLDRDVALKVLPAGKLASDVARNRFHTEALALAKLNHPYIGTIYDFDAQDGVDFLVMEYVPGKTLSDELERVRLSKREVLNLATQIVAALEEAHGRGVVHRDLKPRNIVVTPNRQVKVLDFGLAKLLRPVNDDTADEVSRTEAGVGTLPYMAPEQLRGQATDARTDIYAVGTVLYEMAAGKRPFSNKFAAALAADIQTQAPVPPRQLNPEISLRLQEVILKCLEKDPQNRYQTARDLGIALQQLSGTLEKPTLLPKHRSLRFTALAALCFLVIALTGAYIARRQFWAKPPQGKIIMAVLPFENLSRDPEEDYFCDGLTDEMINQLGRLVPQRLGVIARTSAMQYKGSPKRIDQIGKELSVGYILETSVRREGARVRISTQLIQVRDQSTLWTDTYDYDAANIFSLETDVSRRIASSLALKLLPGQQMTRPQVTSAEAYDAYLQGRYHWHKGSAEEAKKARRYFEQAVRIDPNYAPAFAALAGYGALDDVPTNVAMAKAKEYALRSLELDDSLTQAHTALAGVRFYGDWDWSGAESEFKRALELNPNDAEARRVYSFYLLALGRFDAAIVEVQRAEDLDPVSLLTRVNAGWTFYFARQYDRAIEECRRALELDPSSDGAHACLGQSYRAKGMREEAIAEAERAVTLSESNPARLVALARTYAAFGKQAEAKKVLTKLSGQAKLSYVSPYLLAMTQVALAEKDQALAALEQAYEERDGYLVTLKIDDAFDPLRDNAHFLDLLRRVGFPP